jgi:hypothetical protein
MFPALTRGALAVLAVAVLALGGVVQAQAPPSAQQPQGRYRLGPLRVTPRIVLKNAGVDTNVFQTLDAPTRDEVLIVSPRLDGTMEVGRRFRARGFGYLDLNYYRRQGEEGSTDFYGEGDAELDLGPFTLLGGGGGGQFNQRFSIDIDERLLRQEKHAYVGLAFREKRRFSVRTEARGDVFTFAPGVFRLGGAVQEAMDRNTLSARGQVRYALTNRTALLASGEALEDRFISQPVDVPKRIRHSYRYLAGLEFSQRALVSGRLLAGVRDFPGTLQDGSPPYRGPAVLADLTLPIRQRARLHAIGERDVYYASSLVQLDSIRYRNAFVLTRYQGELGFELPLALTGLLSAGFERSRYLLPYPYPDATRLADRRDHRWTAGVGVTRRFGNSVRIGGHLDWARRVSTLPFFSYEGLRYGLNAEVLP